MNLNSYFPNISPQEEVVLIRGHGYLVIKPVLSKGMYGGKTRKAGDGEYLVKGRGGRGQQVGLINVNPVTLE